MNSLEAKVVILGAQGAGKTSLVVRFVENNFHKNEQSTIGASFLVKKVYAYSLGHAPANFKDKLTIVLSGYRFVHSAHFIA
jgi:GTPase SAR1 family protein